MKKKTGGTGGYAMILVICVMALIVALCLALLLTSSVVFFGAQRESSTERCRILTVSLSQQLEKQLLDPDLNSFTDTAAERGADDGTLWFFVKQGMSSGSWPYFNEDERGHTARYAYRTYTFQDGIPEELREVEKIEILMYWESESGADLAGAPLHISVTCAINGQTCTISTEYMLDVTEIPYEEVGEGGAPVNRVYESWKWSLNWRE